MEFSAFQRHLHTAGYGIVGTSAWSIVLTILEIAEPLPGTRRLLAASYEFLFAVALMAGATRIINTQGYVIAVATALVSMFAVIDMNGWNWPGIFRVGFGAWALYLLARREVRYSFTSS